MFCYAGHGTNVQSTGQDDDGYDDYEPTGMDQALVPMDWATAGVITDDVLFKVGGGL